MRIVKAPQDFSYTQAPRIFLAGSIEMGTAENWQEVITGKLKDVRGTILNPRRDDWDASWVQSIENDQFREQVEWELEAQEKADLIVLYFSPGTKSPITLLELGLCRNRPMIVCCPEGFWRKGNVDIVCHRYAIAQRESLDVLVGSVIEWVSGMV